MMLVPPSAIVLCLSLVLVGFGSPPVSAQCSAPCPQEADDASQCLSFDTNGYASVPSPSCGSSSITITQAYATDNDNDNTALNVYLCPMSSYYDGGQCSNPLPSSIFGTADGTGCVDFSGSVELAGINQVVLVAECTYDIESCDSTLSLTTTCTPSSSSPYLQDFNDVCVGDGNTFTKALPCPASATANCAYTIYATASSSHWYEGSPDASFVVFATQSDFSNWLTGSPYNSVAGPITQSDSFNSGVFYVPPGSSFIFVAYNGNWFEDMTVSGYVEFYPNTAPGSATNSPSQSSTAYANGTLSNIESFAFGFFLGLYDSEPYSPPTFACMQGMTQTFNDVETIVESLLQLTYFAPTEASGNYELSLMLQLVKDFKSTMNACNPNPSSCPGFDQEILSDVLDVAAQVIPGVDVAVDAVKGLTLVYDTFDMMGDLQKMVEAYSGSNWYQLGYQAASIVHELRSLKDGLSRRAISASNASSSLHAHNHNLRHNDGVVRTLPQWRALYNRTYFAAFPPTPVQSLQAQALQMGTQPLRSATATSGTDRQASLGGGAVAGIVVSVVFGVALLAVVAAVAVRRKQWRVTAKSVGNPTSDVHELLASENEAMAPYQPAAVATGTA